MIMRNRVLITGGAGYIGSHTAKALFKAGFDPIVVDNLSLGHRWAARWGPMVEADISDQGAIEAAIREYNISAVIHFAAHAYVGESMREPQKYFTNNVANSLAFLDVLHRCHVRRIVFSSSCAVYGAPDSIPITEDHPKNPINPYGESKLFIEKVLEWYGRCYGFRWAALRYFNAAGADQDGEIGESHDPETHILPLIIDAALGKRGPVAVYGNDYATPDGSPVRDFVHVTDLAHAHVLALERLLSKGDSFALNLGTGHGFSVTEVITLVERLTGAQVPFRLAPRRPGDPGVLVADPRLAQGLIGWVPQHSDMDNIIRSALRWHRNGLRVPSAVSELPTTKARGVVSAD
jgi:UDP-glucose-4-epimerase GalE